VSGSGTLLREPLYTLAEIDEAHPDGPTPALLAAADGVMFLLGVGVDAYVDNCAAVTDDSIGVGI
jgi:hypothetical protein